MENTDYLDRLRAIRNKYGCPKQDEKPLLNLVPSKNTVSSSYRNERKEMTGDIPTLERRNIAEQNSSFGKYDYSRERDLEKIRDTYGERKLDHPSYPQRTSFETQSRHSRRGQERNPEYLKVYQQSNSFINKSHYSVQESFSPIKRMKEESQDVKYPQDSYWRERESKLEELTMNRLKESNSKYGHSLTKNDRPASSHYNEKALSVRNPRTETQNTRPYPSCRSGYQVNKIDQIQKRIHSILGQK